MVHDHHIHHFVDNRENQQSPAKLALSATVHCLIGCGLGEVTGMIIGTGLSFSNAGTIILAVMETAEVLIEVYTPGVMQVKNVPLHAIANPYMGLPTLWNLDLNRLREKCVEPGRNEFLFVITPLVIPGGTASLPKLLRRKWS